MEAAVRRIELPGVEWGASELVPLAYGLKAVRMTIAATRQSAQDLDFEDVREAIEDDVDAADLIASVDLNSKFFAPSYVLPEPECPAYWWTDVYPGLRDRVPGMMECIQAPGEMLYVPHGWWHVVLNLDWTVAITHNFISPATFPDAFQGMRRKHPHYARRWATKLRKRRPAQAQQLLTAEVLGVPEGAVSDSDSSSGWRSD